MEKKRYWMGDVDEEDDFGDRYTDTMIDGRTKTGTWANMTEKSWQLHGVGRLGIGYGQKYKKQEDGRWLRVDG